MHASASDVIEELEVWSVELADLTFELEDGEIAVDAAEVLDVLVLTVDRLCDVVVGASVVCRLIGVDCSFAVLSCVLLLSVLWSSSFF